MLQHMLQQMLQHGSWTHMSSHGVPTELTWNSRHLIWSSHKLTSSSHASPKQHAKPCANHTFRSHGAARMSSHGAHMELTWISHDAHMSAHGTDMELTWSSHDLTSHAHWGHKVTHIWYVTTSVVTYVVTRSMPITYVVT